jgi:undecaprenyl-diphosphatase
MLKRLLSQLSRWLPNIEPAVLLLLALGIASLWGFIEIADEVFEGETSAFDNWAIRALRTPGAPHDPIGPRWVEEVARDISALGGLAFVTIATAGIGVYLLIDGKPRMALFVIGSTASGAMLGMFLKAIFARPRPDLVPHLSQTFSTSFPSGHSLTAAVVYLTLGALVASVVANAWLKIYLLAVGVGVAVAVGDPHLLGCSLPDGRAGRVACGSGLGAALLAGGPPFASSWRGRGA